MNISHTFLLVMISCTLTSQSQIKWNATKDLAASSFGNNHPRIVLHGDEYIVHIGMEINLQFQQN